MSSLRPSLAAAACVASLLVLVAGCDKDKKGVEPPAELVDLKPSLAVDKIWDTGIGGGGEKLRLSLGLVFSNGSLYAAARDGEVVALDPRAVAARLLWHRYLSEPRQAGRSNPRSAARRRTSAANSG